jgi:hypothetical protein
MNENRVKRLAKEGYVEFTRKIMLRLSRIGLKTEQLAAAIAKSSVESEDVFSEPDFTFSLTLPKPHSDHRLVCVQTPDGKYVRVVGIISINGTSKK